MTVVIVGMQNGDFIGFIFSYACAAGLPAHAAMSASATPRFINFIFSP
jgi:hypothetical protein